MDNCCQETPHQEVFCPQIIPPSNRPKAAGLKMCLSPTRTKFLDPIANSPIKKNWYHGESGETSKAIIIPDTIAALGKKKGLPRNLANRKSEPIVTVKDKNNKSRGFIPPAWNKLVSDIAIRYTAICILGVLKTVILNQFHLAIFIDPVNHIFYRFIHICCSNLYLWMFLPKHPKNFVSKSLSYCRNIIEIQNNMLKLFKVSQNSPSL